MPCSIGSTAGAGDLCHLALYAAPGLAYSQFNRTNSASWRGPLLSSMQEMLFPAATVFLGYTVLGITGFGSALIIVPLLAWHWPLAEVVTLTLLLDLPASLLLGGMNRQYIHWQELKHLLPGVVVGALLGLWLTQQLSSRWPLVALGMYVAGVGIRTLRTAPSQPSSLPRPWSLIAGGAIGLVEEDDRIEIDIPNRSIHLAISDSELKARRAKMEAKGKDAWKPVDRQRAVSPALRAYAAMTTSAARGAVRDVTQIEK